MVYYYGDGRISFDDTVREYANDNDMSVSLATRFLSERSSLQVAAELMGFNVTLTSRDLLNSLGTFLDRKGYTVPRMFERGEETFKPIKVEKEVGKMRTDITKEQYLELRRNGMKRSDAQHKLGLNPATFYAFLKQWGIKDKDVEEKVLSAMREGEKVSKALSVDIGITATREPAMIMPPVIKPTSDGTKYVTVRIPVTSVEWPEQFQGLPTITFDRDMLIQLGIICLQNAAAWAHRELVDILGEDTATQPLQAFMERKCQVG